MSRLGFGLEAKVSLGVIGGLLVFAFLTALGIMWSLGVGWFAGETSLRSFNHVRQTYAEGYDDVRALDALAANVCVFRAAEKTALASGDTNAASQRDSQVLAFEARFNSLRGEYDAYMQDHFRGGVIRPRRLPLPYPTLAERTASLC